MCSYIFDLNTKKGVNENIIVILTTRRRDCPNEKGAKQNVC